MKKVLFFATICVVSLWIATNAIWAGQVVTSEDKSWARQAVEQEGKIDVSECPPNTLAVLYFVNKSERAVFNPLQKGMAIMLITDLSKLDKIQIVERTRFQALLDELGLAQTGLVKEETVPEVGRILCAQTLVGGDITSGESAELKFDSDLIDVSTENVFGKADSEGALKELFKLEKELVFEIVEQLGIEITPEERAELEKPLSMDVEALLFMFRGVDASDAGDYQLAETMYQRALARDPNFSMARDLIAELRTMGFAGDRSGENPFGRELGDIPPSPPASDRERFFLRDLRERTSLTDRLTGDKRTQRFRTPDEVQRRQDLLPDSDGDGVPDFEDGCPTDPKKTEPGACGCGVPDTDSDGDGVLDCEDQCPDDPNKKEPGVCGCGNPDTDADGDGIADCHDQCPDDPDKNGPGICGCGVADTDSDGDGTPDCIDGCPTDPNKTDPGVCGCGVPDVDTDGDGNPDCVDLCPDNPEKMAPGVCGCSEPDIDTDGDGVYDCVDSCPDDPNKSSPGACGCGVADTDSDGDGTPDCIDGCPTDPNKTDPGVCGCGVADTDTDGDGKADCIDGCPTDPNKTDPGVCGCGVADTDSDGDGKADCIDGCPTDPNKTDPGVCGCGVADTDSDGDGKPDCVDLCPQDPLKTDPGSCGCGESDMDSDGDGYPDCMDECPSDPNKTDPGVCGCGNPETGDSDGDGLADCVDPCPDDPMNYCNITPN